jgi:hypothetical protein
MSFGVEGDWKLLKGHAPNIRNAIHCCWSCSLTVDQDITPHG